MCPRIAVAGQVFGHSFDGSLVATAISLQICEVDFRDVRMAQGKG